MASEDMPYWLVGIIKMDVTNATLIPGGDGERKLTPNLNFLHENQIVTNTLDRVSFTFFRIPTECLANCESRREVGCQISSWENRAGKKSLMARRH